MKTHHISAYVLITLGVLFAAIVLVTHGIALLLLLPLAMIVGPLILLLMTANERTDRSGK
jgi:Flp pilus assembly protein TadB